MNKIILAIICISFHIHGLAQSIEKEFSANYPDHLFEVTKVMVHDIVNPPAAARYYAYCNLAAYYASGKSDLLPDLSKKNNLKAKKTVCLPLASTYALLHTARLLLPSGESLSETEEKLLLSTAAKYNLSNKVLAASKAYGNKVAQRVIEYSKSDGYTNLSARIGYTPKAGEGFWYPTPPAYIEAIEPHWNTMRPFFLDSAQQFAPKQPVSFDMDTTSLFYKEQLMGVYQAVKSRTKEQEEIAKFWDCNPFEVKLIGHTMIGLKKITPGGHWMGITGIATRKVGFTFDQTVRTHALVALTLHDAFISCWDEKYRSDRIRPETVINQHFDKEWKPVLQTPPFPEYTSGHSVASGAASTVLTQIFGDDFKFSDDTETYFGLPVRDFDSFNHAADEAAISRLYGGIHYIDACEIGLDQGRNIGRYIIEEINKK